MNRIESVDVFRLLAIIAVISLHTTPFSADLGRVEKTFTYSNVLIDQTARFAVPFFFVISGYFWGLKVEPNHNPLAVTNTTAKRIAIIFASWSLIYLLPYNLSGFYEYGLLGPIKIAYWHIVTLLEQPSLLLLQGTKGHLWFLTALLCCLYISTLFVYKGHIKMLLVFSIALYIIGIAAKAYVDTPIGIKTDFDTRNGPFFGLVFFASGLMISRFKPNKNWVKYGLLLTCFGYILQLSETYWLWKTFGTSPKQEYVIGTYFVGIGVAVLSLSNHKLLCIPVLSTIGRMTLGIYAIHNIFVDLFGVVDKHLSHPLWEISYVFLVLGLSVISIVLLSKNRITRKIVM